MKRVLTIVLAFAVIMAALLGVNELWQRSKPAPEAAEEEGEREMVVTNTMDASSATVITLADGAASILGVGAAAADDGTVTIAYPGTYRVEGTLSSGQLVVDLGDFNGTVYIILNGASITSSTGPALHVAEAELTVLYLMDGTENTLRDGSSYFIQERQEKKSGAGIYSADDLVIAGDGALTVHGQASDGIRTKDAMAILGGNITVYAQDDGIQASDYLKISGGTITVVSNGDGLRTTDGFVEISDGVLQISSEGDGIDAAAEVRISGGSLQATAFGGAENYAAAVLQDRSAKGVKAESIDISGGRITLNTADDGIHAARDAAIRDCVMSIVTGDDGVHAARGLEISGASLEIGESYEGIEAETITVSDTQFRAVAENNAVDSGEGGFTSRDSRYLLTAPRAVSSDGAFNMFSSYLYLDADGTDSLFSFTEANIVGGTILACAGTGRSDVLLEKGRIPGSIFVGFGETVAAGTPIVISDPAGAQVYAYTPGTDVGAVLLSTGALLEGQPYILTAGNNAVAVDCLADGCFVSEPAASSEFGRGSGRR